MVVATFSCCTTNKSSTSGNGNPPDYAALKYERAVIRYWELDGCRYLLELENGSKLNPGTLPAAFEKDNLEVWVKYKKVDRVNICMSGTTVDITEIYKREE